MIISNVIITIRNQQGFISVNFCHTCIFQYEIYRFYFKLTNHYLYNDHDIEHILYAKNNQVRAFDHHFKTCIRRKLNGHEKCVIFFLYQLYIIA